MGLFHINGGQGGAFNVPWEKWWESLGLVPSFGLEFCFISIFLLALVWVKEDEFEGVNMWVRRGWFGTLVYYSRWFYHLLLLIMLLFCSRVAEERVKY